MLGRKKTSDVMKYCALNMDMDSLVSAIQFTFHLDVMMEVLMKSIMVLISLPKTELMNRP